MGNMARMGYLSRIFLQGLLALLPITLTVYLIVWITSAAEALLGQPLKALLPESIYIPGTGVLLVIMSIFAVGFFINSYFTKGFLQWLGRSIERVPIVGAIYTPLRDVTKMFARHETGHSVVLVHFANLGIDVMGLVTRDQFDDLPADMRVAGSVAVFFPLSYGVGGVTVMVPRANLRETSLSAEKAMQLAITGWVKSAK